jgi:hypothetical protein
MTTNRHEAIYGLEEVSRHHQTEIERWLRNAGPGPASVHRGYLAKVDAALAILREQREAGTPVHPDALRACGYWLDLTLVPCGICDRCEREAP